MKSKLMKIMKESGLDEYIRIQEIGKMLRKYYEPLADSIIMFQDSLDKDTADKILWLIQHSSLLIMGQQKMRFIFDGYDLELMAEFTDIVLLERIK